MYVIYKLYKDISNHEHQNISKNQLSNHEGILIMFKECHALLQVVDKPVLISNEHLNTTRDPGRL